MFIGQLGEMRNRLQTEQEWSEPPVTVGGIFLKRPGTQSCSKKIYGM